MIKLHRPVKVDTSEKKIASFITAIVMIVLSGFMLFICWEVGASIDSQTGIEALSKIVTIPILIILHIVLGSFAFSGTACSIFAIFSKNKAIKIISIFLLLINLAILGVEAYTISMLF